MWEMIFKEYHGFSSGSEEVEGFIEILWIDWLFILFFYKKGKLHHYSWFSLSLYNLILRVLT